MNCPVCGYKDYSVGKCSSCGTDATSLLRLSELPDIYYNKAVEFIMHDNLKDALESLATAVNLNPGDVDALILLGKVYAELGDFERSVHHWNKAIELDDSKRDEIDADIKKALTKGKLSSAGRKRPIKKSVKKTSVRKKSFKTKSKSTEKAKKIQRKKGKKRPKKILITNEDIVKF